MFFYLSKIVWFLLTPGNFLVFALLIGMLLLYKGKTKWAKRILTTAVICLLFLIILPVGQWSIYPLESRFETNPQLPEKVDGIIVLGGSGSSSSTNYWKQVEYNRGAERMLYFLALVRKYPQAKAIFTGGTGLLMKSTFGESDVAKQFLELNNENLERYIFETESRNTHENVVFSKKLAKPQAGENWIVVTSAYHIPRAVGIFRQNDWPVIPFPVDHQSNKWKLTQPNKSLDKNLEIFSLATKEYLGLIVYRLTGKTSSFLPK